MAQIDSYRSRRDALEAGSAEDFGEIFYQQMRGAPWVLCSLGLHGVVALLLMLMPTDVVADEPARRLDVAQAPEIQELLDEVEPEVEVEKPIDEVEKPIDDPVIKDVKVSDHDETDNDMDDDQSLGDPRFDSDSPFDSQGTNDKIGIGGNAGGPFGGRRGGRRNLRVLGGGGSSQISVDLALEWFKNHQSPGGQWDSDGFQDQCKLNKCSGPGESVYDPGQTGLALLCFLGAGETHNQGQYKDTVKNGLNYLKGIQDGEGCFGAQVGHQWQYNHVCAALAMTEAYGSTGSRLLKEPAQRAVNFVHKSQNPYLAWRYGIRDGDNDTSVTGWAVMVLKSAKMAELEVDEGSFRGAMAWVEKMTEPEFGRVGYQRRGGRPARTQDMQEKFPAEKSESLTGVGLLVRIFAGQDPAKNEFIQKGADLMAKQPPRWDVDAGTIDFYYWYYATLAMFQVGGKQWKDWRAAMEPAIVDHQRKEAGRDELGSWDPLDPWASEGGRVYSTAMNCLSLEVYYRYKRVFVGAGAR